MDYYFFVNLKIKFMKLQIRKFATLMMGVFFLTLTSCDEDFEGQETTAKTSSGFKILNYGDTTLNARSTNVNNILSFQTEEDYHATVDSLELEYDKYSESMSQIFNGLSDDEINNKIKSENIDLEKPLTNFETFHNFLSLRNAIDEREKVWLQNPDPNFHETPQIHSIPTFSERCLWNYKGEIMVEGKIYKYTEDDTKFIKIEDGDFAKLLLINAGDATIFNNDMISLCCYGSSKHNNKYKWNYHYAMY